MSFSERINMYKCYNDIALKGEIVVYGSSYMAGFPFYELSRKYLFSNAIYNRSIDNLTLKDAENGLRVCVTDIDPQKIFLALGDNDLDNPDAMAVYERILERIAEKCPRADVFVLPVCGDSAAVNEFNRSLRALARKHSAEYISLNYLKNGDSGAYNSVFKQILPFFRNRVPSLSEAFALGSY